MCMLNTYFESFRSSLCKVKIMIFLKLLVNLFKDVCMFVFGSCISSNRTFMEKIH